MEIMPCTREIDCASVAKNSGASRFSTTGGTMACASAGWGAGGGRLLDRFFDRLLGQVFWRIFSAAS